MLGQAGVALLLVTYAWLVSPMEFSLEFVQRSIDGLLSSFLSLARELLMGLGQSFQHFLAWSPLRSELFTSVPEIPLNGTVVTYAAFLAVLLWIASNRLLLQTNGHPEETQS
jgi:hypothetical protein